MEIVPTSTQQKKVNGLDELSIRKIELKEQIQYQKIRIVDSSQQLLSPASVASYIFGRFTKGLNMLDGVMIGYKMIRSLRRVFRK
ncbi:MAG TPA: hypothetical protein VFC36_06175 [Paludibacter sp.]|nr:hypothetical protein [Paludibacter sp.]